MDKLKRIIDFIQYVLTAWRQAFGGRKPESDSGAETTAQEMDEAAWKEAQRRYQESLKQDDKDFWRGEEK